MECFAGHEPDPGLGEALSEGGQKGGGQDQIADTVILPDYQYFLDRAKIDVPPFYLFRPDEKT